MQKAKSRLTSKKSSHLTKELSRPSSRKVRYVRYLPLLVVSIIIYLATGWLITNIHPQQVAHIIIPNTYLPFTLPLFIGNVLLFSFIFLNTRRGILLSILINTLIFLKLQLVIFEWHWLLPLILIILALELFASFIQYHKNQRL